MRIKPTVLQMIADSQGLRGRLCADLGKSYPTIQKWVEENHDNLTKAAVLKIIREELGLTDEQILEEDQKAVA